jgi:hypothetical protein
MPTSHQPKTEEFNADPLRIGIMKRPGYTEVLSFHCK